MMHKRLILFQNRRVIIDTTGAFRCQAIETLNLIRCSKKFRTEKIGYSISLNLIIFFNF